MTQIADRTKPGLATLLLRAERWLDAAARARLHAAGRPQLTRAHSLVFAYLDEGGTRPAELARRAGVTRQAVAQSVAELSALGLVDLVPDPRHGRAKIVRLTEAGERTRAAARETFAELERELGRRIGVRRVRALREALEADWGPPPPAVSAGDAGWAGGGRGRTPSG